MSNNNLQRPLFLDPANELAFRQYGYVKIPFLSNEEVSQLLDQCDALNGNFSTQFTTTVWSDDPVYRKSVYDLLKSFYVPHINRLMIDCKTAMATILTKHPGNDSAIDIHQDWSFTDEAIYSAVNIWVPLVDTDETNGALYVLPFSHKFDVLYRGRHVAPQFANVKHLIWSLGQAITARAGEAIFFDVKMVHYSNPNRSTLKRTATAMVAMPQEAEILHFINYNPSENQVTKMSVDEGFYNRYAHNDKIPISDNASTFNLHRHQYSVNEFESDYQKLLVNPIF